MKNENEDVRSEKCEERLLPTCESGTQCHQQDWNAIAREGNTVSPPNYEVALDEIRTLVILQANALDTVEACRQKISDLLKAVNK